ncbi:MAG: sigma-54-dependent Fis family transcriptional regulator [Chitinispirillaceae bacterium]|nr:sigma-54-dependent Fis family transcriptional regulator [Chitinispirillaceae bacterium]
MASTSLYPVLIVDDEVQFLQSVAITLRMAGLEVTTCSGGNEALAVIAGRRFGVVILDILMPERSGADLLPEVRKISPFSQVVMVTAVNDVGTAVACMQKGAFDYLIKPVEKDRLIMTVRRALDMAELGAENRLLKERLLRNRIESPEVFEKIVTRNGRMIAVFQYVEAIAQTSMPVLIQGETGTGKELIAQSIHRASGRTGKFVVVNAAGLNDQLFCDALFGHERGAFTGAECKRNGLVAASSGGTLFLDEIGELSAESQVKLLRLFEDRTYYPAGSDAQRTTDARFIVATNRDIVQLQKDGIFRTDLYFRLEAHKIELPPLRERREDVRLLVDTFIEDAAGEQKKEPIAVPEAVYALLQEYPFPGNVRELRNMIVDAVSVARSAVLEESYFRERLKNQQAICPDASPSDRFTREGISRWPQLPSLKEAEQLLIEESLRRSNGNQTLAAQLLGLTRSALNKRLTRAKDTEGDK